MAQLVKRLALDVSSGHDVTIREFEPHVRLCRFSLSLSLSALPPARTHKRARALSLKINK